MVKKWRPSFWAEEHGQIISGVGPFLKQRAIERQAYTHREQCVSRGDKAVRAQSMRGRMAMLGLYVRQGAPWFADLRAELLSFPAGRHDDQVDALGLVGQLLDKISAGWPMALPQPPGMIRGMILAPPDHEAIAAEVLAAMDGARQIAPFSARYPGLTLDDAYRISARLCALRTARGERVIGRKIGFTNRTIWAEYGVYAPMWGFVFDTTMRDLQPPRQSAQHPFTLASFAEPRIEPEIVFRLAAAPSPDMDEAALFGCIDWVAQGFEIVHSVFPGWKFAPADAVIVNGLHGALLLAPRHPVGFGSATDWVSNLAGFEIDLWRDGAVVDRGHAANVLDGPLSALRHLVGLLARDPVNSPLATGDIVTTGTLTRAFPILPGESWSTTLHGIELGGRPVWFT